MAGQIGSAGASGNLPDWSLLFAREPDSDLDLELDEPGTVHKPASGSHSPAPQKPPRRRTLMLILFLLVVAGGAYVAMDPEAVMKLLAQEEPPPPLVTTPRPPAGPRPSPPPTALDSEASDSIAAPGTIPTPLFGEGQKVSVISNTASPMSPVFLTHDAAGIKPGPSVTAARTLFVLDAELHDHTWVYLVRTDDGTKGWLPETQLVAKP